MIRFGHEKSDNAIRTVAEMLKAAVSASAVVSRTGGDEFTVMAILNKDSQFPLEAEKKLLESMKDFNKSSGLSYMVDASYGWDFRPASELVDLDDCVNRADDKMYDMKSKRKMSNRFSGKAGEEISRRFGSAKQSVFILSEDAALREELSALFDASYLMTSFEAPEDALRQLEICDEAVMLIVDNCFSGRSGIECVRDMTEKQRRNTILILLLEHEAPDVIAEAFALGVDDVLVKPYHTVLNKCRIRLLGQMNTTNRKLTQMLEQQMSL